MRAIGNISLISHHAVYTVLADKILEQIVQDLIISVGLYKSSHSKLVL